MTPMDRIRAAVRGSLAATIHREVRPEDYRARDGSKISSGLIALPGYTKKYGLKPLAPRNRLSARLAVALVLAEITVELAKECRDDAEGIADAKAHGQSLDDLIPDDDA